MQGTNLAAAVAEERSKRGSQLWGALGGLELRF